MICNTSQNVITFRRPLIMALQQEGHEISVVASDDEYKEEIEKNSGIAFYCIKGKNNSVSVFKSLKYQKEIRKVIQKEKPDVVFTFQAKPNTFGVYAAKKEKVKNVFAMVEGAGAPFTNTGLKWKIIRKITCVMYRKAFKRCEKVFFLNEDDKAEFVGRRLVKESQTIVTHGIGVDLERFAYQPIKNYRAFLMMARMVEEKGVYEYCKCARLVKQKYPDVIFNYLGAEGDVHIADIQKYIDDGSITYLGTTKDVRPYLENVLLLLLSSYREGLPMSVMEAEAMGRAVIVSDGVGCKDTVVDGYNGFMVPRGDYEKMAERVSWCIEHPKEAEQMGRNARAFAEANWDAKDINEKIIKEINGKE